MNILSKPCGVYETNCYILKFDSFEIVIDPGSNATIWVEQHTSNIVAILNTHGHFDHIWSNAELRQMSGAKIYVPKDDVFFLANDMFGMGVPPSSADREMEHDESLDINGVKVTFHHFPGHTPGTSAIEVEGHLFSGDFIFASSIGRTDFPYSYPKAMATSLHKFAGSFADDMPIHPGHGGSTTAGREKKNIPQFLGYLR
jgi:hydroxyacylglutathione hydrolase